jgi:hypothetical protein
MSKRYKDWDFEIAYLRKRFGISQEDARGITVHHWIVHGDYRPFIAAVNNKEFIEPLWLDQIAKQLETGALALNRSAKHRPNSVAASAWVALAQKFYDELHGTMTNDKLIARLARLVGKSEKTVRNAIRPRKNSR